MVKNGHYRLLLMLVLGHMMVDLSQGALPALLPTLKDSLELNYTQSAAILMTMTFASSIIQPLFGYFSDRFATGWMLPAGVMLSGLGFAMLGLVNSYWLVLLVVFVAGLGIAAYHPQGAKDALASSPRRVVAMSWFVLGGNAGFAVGPLVLLAFVSLWGQTGITMFALPGLLMGLLLLVALNKKQTWQAESKAQQINPQPMGKRIKPITLLLGSVICRSTLQSGFLVFMPFYLTSQLGWEKLNVAPLLTYYLVAGSLGTLLGGQLGQKIGPKRFFILSILLVAPVNYLFLQAQADIWLYLWLGLSAAGVMAPWSSMVVMAQDIMPDRSGMAAALMVGFSIGGGGLCATLLGLVADHIGIMTVMWIMVALPLLAAAIGVWVPQDKSEATVS